MRIARRAVSASLWRCDPTATLHAEVAGRTAISLHGKGKGRRADAYYSEPCEED